MLPIDTEVKPCKTKGGCTLAGDARVDENIALMSMHTLWVREHNWVATELKKLNPQWKNNQLFYTARKIIGGIWQHITYQEYLPLLVKLPKYKKYNSGINPSISNSFATAAFRYGHSLVPNQFEQLDKGFNVKHKPVYLQEAFFNRGLIVSRGIEPTIFGLVKNFSREVDNKFAFAVARKLFIGLGQDGHLDLTALNIQRGRDHGLRGYNDYRKACRLPVAKTWKQVKKIMVPGAGARFQNSYNSPDDIDLFAGGISEIHAPGAIVGPLFRCILGRQFQFLRDGDRYYYENKGVFTSSQLEAIRKVKMSTVLCSTLKGIVSIQPNAFNIPDSKNKRTSCKSSVIGKLDLRPWKAKTRHDEPEVEPNDEKSDEDIQREMKQTEKSIVFDEDFEDKENGDNIVNKEGNKIEDEENPHEKEDTIDNLEDNRFDKEQEDADEDEQEDEDELQEEEYAEERGKQSNSDENVDKNDGHHDIPISGIQDELVDRSATSEDDQSPDLLNEDEEDDIDNIAAKNE